MTIQRKQMTVASLDQRYYLVREEDKLAALTRLFETEEITSALVFAKTRVGTGDLANELSVRGFQAEALSGDFEPGSAGSRVLNRFAITRFQVLVATDVAARGSGYRRYFPCV
ncbi:MAG: DEAD/DEAH box helicase [Chloroflexi bacterium]|nr:DEAD/DEAH box helicase [Chloroflexota bacterium]